MLNDTNRFKRFQTPSNKHLNFVCISQDNIKKILRNPIKKFYLLDPP